MNRPVVFEDRRDAGIHLGNVLRGMDLDDPLVLGIPRGGVTVAYEVARALHAPLDVVVARSVQFIPAKPPGFSPPLRRKPA